MKKVSVKSSRGSYSIWIGSGLLEKTGAILKGLGLKGKVMVVTQDSVAKYFLKKVMTSLAKQKMTSVTHLIPEGETAKSQTELFRLLDALCEQDFERGDTLLALGGGVTGDLTGFAASIYMRGISFVNVPTTLLAQVDSAIGGKTGINLRYGKNLAGAFYPPKTVISDIRTLGTLPSRELYASLAEVVKYGVIRDARLFSFLEKNADQVLAKKTAALEKIVAVSSAIKAGVVSRDEHETKGERMILNFGHTFGHGFERALHYKGLLHGEAVALGMVCASDLAVRLKMFSKDNFGRLVRLLQKLNLPVSLSGRGISTDSVLTAMSRDKKKKGGKLRFVLPTVIGKVTVRDNVPQAMMEEILVSHGAAL